jgi:ABC-type transporter Mla MlaB component
LPAPEQSRTAMIRVLRPPFKASPFVLVIDGSIEPTDIPRLCERVHALLEGSDAAMVICDVAAVIGPDAVAVDALARFQLTARRLGCRVLVRHAGDDLRNLVALMGLSDILPCLRT